MKRIKNNHISIKVMSFGFKYGAVEDASFLQDVRFLKNPYYVDDLRKKTGLCDEVSSYVMDSPHSKRYVSRLKKFLDFYISNYTLSQRDELVIAIGCTGGKHRSVTVAREVYSHLLKKGYNAEIIHRDIDKDK